MQITVLEARGKAALVEWRDANGIQRATIPATEIERDGETADTAYDTLAQGIPFGEAWESLNLGNVGSERVARELRERGIWNLEDARRNLSTVRAGLQAAYSADLETILRAARDAESRAAK